MTSGVVERARKDKASLAVTLAADVQLNASAFLFPEGNMLRGGGGRGQLKMGLEMYEITWKSEENEEDDKREGVERARFAAVEQGDVVS